MLKLLFLILAALLVPAALVSPLSAGERSTAARAQTSAGVDALVRMERSTAVFTVLYQYGQNLPAANGAYGPNITAPRSAWYLEYQRAGAVDVIDGVLRPDGDPTLIATGLKMFRFGLQRQSANGSFPGSAWPFHGTAMFLSEAAPALLVLKSSPYAGRFRSDLQYDTLRMQRAAYAMVRSVHGAGKIDDHTKNHRWFEAAIALGATGALAGDHTLVRWSTRYALHGIAMQRADGVMPEDGGHDSGYQALGMVNAARYLQLVPFGRHAASLYRALARGEAWELSRVMTNGAIDQSGDTRTAGCQEHDPTGHCKTAFYAPIFSALAHWAAISGDARYAAAAHAVWLHSGYGGH